MLHQKICRSLGLVLLILSISSPALAKKKRRSSRYKKIRIKLDQIAVYEKASFDSEIIQSLKKGRVIIVSKRKHKGPADLGVFYKIKYGKKKYGFVTDTDLNPKNKSFGSGKAKKSGVSNPYEFEDPMGEEDESNLPLYFRKYLGVSYGVYNFAETLNNTTLNSMTSLIGIKASGPVLMQVPLDINIMYMTSPPEYYNNVPDGGGNSSASGFAVLSDVALMLPLMETKKFIVTYGFGVFLGYTNFSVSLPNLPDTQAGDTIPSSEIRLGAVLPVSAGVRLGRFMLKADAKYIWETERYFGFSGSLMYEL